MTRKDVNPFRYEPRVPSSANPGSQTRQVGNVDRFHATANTPAGAPGASESEPDLRDEIGDVLETIRPTDLGSLVILWTLGLLAAPLLILPFSLIQDATTMVIVATCGFAFWGAWMAVTLRETLVRIDVGTLGIRVRLPAFRARCLRYSECKSLSYWTVQTNVNGVPTPPVLYFVLRPTQGWSVRVSRFAGKPPARPARVTGLPPMASLDNARDVASLSIAERMLTQWHATGQTDWGHRLRFVGHELVYRDLLGRERRMPCAHFAVSTRNGELVIHNVRDHGKFAKVAMSGANTWPGLICLQRIAGR